jgi:hypothetical protein
VTFTPAGLGHRGDGFTGYLSATLDVLEALAVLIATNIETPFVPGGA